MKKFYFLVLCFTASIVVYGATIPRAILSHDGVLTQYDLTHWQDAFTNAVDGDIIYLTPGSFHGNLTITKAVSVIGAGVALSNAFFSQDELETAYGGCASPSGSTVIEGDINIAVVSSSHPTLIEGIVVPSWYGFEPSVTISTAITNLTIRRCQFSNQFRATANVTNLVFEQNFASWFYCDNLITPTIRDCWFNNMNNAVGLEFTNCMIGGGYDFNNCHFINCICLEKRENNTFTYCLTRDQTGTGNTFDEHCKIPEDWFFYRKTKAQFLEANYLGNDGTVIGPLGGPAPFTFKPSQPYVASSALNYNATTKKLNVTMTINKGE